MRALVFFDLPTDTSEDRRNYRLFRRSLLKNGFMMLQESVYVRLLINPAEAESAIDAIKKQKPKKGIVMVLTVTEKQYSKMEIITGEYHTDLIDTDERLIIL